jgi:hypothetical protein
MKPDRADYRDFSKCVVSADELGCKVGEAGLNILVGNEMYSL